MKRFGSTIPKVHYFKSPLFLLTLTPALTLTLNLKPPKPKPNPESNSSMQCVSAQ